MFNPGDIVLVLPHAMMSTLQGDNLGIVLQNPEEFTGRVKVALRALDGDCWLFEADELKLNDKDFSKDQFLSELSLEMRKFVNGEILDSQNVEQTLTRYAHESLKMCSSIVKIKKYIGELGNLHQICLKYKDGNTNVDNQEIRHIISQLHLIESECDQYGPKKQDSTEHQTKH